MILVAGPDAGDGAVRWMGLNDESDLWVMLHSKLYTCLLHHILCTLTLNMCCDGLVLITLCIGVLVLHAQHGLGGGKSEWSLLSASSPLFPSGQYSSVVSESIYATVFINEFKVGVAFLASGSSCTLYYGFAP